MNNCRVAGVVADEKWSCGCWRRRRYDIDASTGGIGNVGVAAVVADEELRLGCCCWNYGSGRWCCWWEIMVFLLLFRIKMLRDRYLLYWILLWLSYKTKKNNKLLSKCTSIALPPN
jgi:hypothetical protein